LEQFKDCGWWVIVMEKLSGDFKMLSEFTNPDQRSVFFPHMETFLHRIHSAGFVHGDFREYNIMCNHKAKQVKVVDFEFSGRENDAVYPVQLNTTIQWPPGVEFRAPLKKQHDLDFLARHRDGKSSDKTPSNSESEIVPSNETKTRLSSDQLANLEADHYLKKTIRSSA